MLLTLTKKGWGTQTHPWHTPFERISHICFDLAEQMINSVHLTLHLCMCVIRLIFPIHPSFRVLALAEPPIVGPTSSSSSNNRGQQWLGPEMLTMFLYHTVAPLAKAEEMSLIEGLVSPTYKTSLIFLLTDHKLFPCFGYFYHTFIRVTMFQKKQQSNCYTSCTVSVRQTTLQ